ncbi:hypothetical protein ACFSX5_13480 [Devosia albogilva]|uniref:Dynamin n=1 Tax=Devosia albogilva TaxID=429726 RepID=A0ABW5QM18_9HYPH
MKRRTIIVLAAVAAVVLLAVYLLENFNPDAPASNPSVQGTGASTPAPPATPQ